ncbi:hypothetical protein ACOSQ3_024138 [Xanthoceras sorbifolium]
MTEESSTNQTAPIPSGAASSLQNDKSIFGGGNNNGSGKDLQFIQSGYRLNEKNYLKWSQVVQTFLKGKGKLRHLTGTGPLKEDPRFDAWDEEDSMIMTWLWNSMTPEVNDTCMFLATAREIWEFIQQTYSKVKDAVAAQVYEIRTKAMSTKHGNGSVTDYANTLQNLWQELDHYRCVRITNPADTTVVRKMLEQDRVYDFLAGLNMEYDQVRIQILGREEVPPLNVVISMVRAEESRRSVMVQSVHEEGSALASNGSQSLHQMKTASDGHKPPNANPSNLWCTYYKKPRHTKDRCWKLHGKPSTSSKE